MAFFFVNDNELTPEEVREKFEDPKVRSEFIRKVFSILTVQIMFILFFVILTATISHVQVILLNNPEILVTGIIIMLVTLITISCCERPRRKVPTNYILLSLFTIGQTIIMCYFTMRYRSYLLTKSENKKFIKMAFSGTNDNEIINEEIREQFEDPKVRTAFVQKVFSILTGQLMFTFFFVFLTAINEELRRTLAKNMLILIIAMVLTVVTSFVLSCCEGPRRKVPMNYILLGLFTIGETILMCYFTMHFRSHLLLYAVGITAAVCFFASIIACFSNWDFTSSGCICFLMIMALIMLIFGLVMIFIPKSPILIMVYASLGAGVFTLWLIFDIQIMLGGKHKNAISPEDYVFAALSIYIDIILIFQYVLMLLDACDV